MSEKKCAFVRSTLRRPIKISKNNGSTLHRLKFKFSNLSSRLVIHPNQDLIDEKTKTVYLACESETNGQRDMSRLHYYLLRRTFVCGYFCKKGPKPSLYFKLTLDFVNGRRDKWQCWNFRVPHISLTTPPECRGRIFYIICSIQFKFCGNRVLFFPSFYMAIYMLMVIQAGWLFFIGESPRDSVSGPTPIILMGIGGLFLIICHHGSCSIFLLQEYFWK